MNQSVNGIATIILVLLANSATGETAKAAGGPAAVVPIVNEPAPRLVVDAPLPDQLRQGRVVIQYRAEHLRIVAVFGVPALKVSPRIGHIHVTVDDSTWHWADASGEPLIMNGFKPGPHKVLIELVDANHKTISRETVSFVIPQTGASPQRD